MKKLFNYGQVHFFLQLAFNNNGYAPPHMIRQWLDTIPAEMFEYGRFSGTMSNYMNIDEPGYNFPKHVAQIEGRKGVDQPTQSYLISFAHLARELGLKKVFFTANIHKAFLEGKVDEMYKSLDYIAYRLPLCGIELGNECDMEPLITGSSGGTVSAMDRIRYRLGTGGAEQIISDRVNRYMDFVQNHGERIKARYNVPIGVTVANPSTLRGRTWNRVVLARNFYDAMCPHPYITAANVDEVYQKIGAWLAPLRKDRQIWASETNWNYIQEPKPVGDYHNTTFRKHLFDALRDNGAEFAAFHTIWAGDKNANNW